jgi:hypothetical protein
MPMEHQSPWKEHCSQSMQQSYKGKWPLMARTMGERWTKRTNSLDLANNELQKVETQKIYVFFETEQDERCFLIPM